MTEKDIYDFLVNNLLFDVETRSYDGQYITLRIRDPDYEPQPYSNYNYREDGWYTIGSVAIDDRKHTGYF